MREPKERPFPLVKNWYFLCENSDDLDAITTAFVQTFKADPNATLPVSQYLKLAGYVYGHPEFDDGSPIMTSCVKSITEAENCGKSGDFYDKIFVATTASCHQYYFCPRDLNDNSAVLFRHLIRD